MSAPYSIIRSLDVAFDGTLSALEVRGYQVAVPESFFPNKDTTVLSVYPLSKFTHINILLDTLVVSVPAGGPFRRDWRLSS